MDKTLIMMIGLPASGKSTLAKQYADNSGFIIHSSDDLRKELYGDSSIQGDNGKLFVELHKRIFADMENGENIIYDATNLTYKKRRTFLKEVELRFPNKYRKYACVMATTFNNCIAIDSQRDNPVGFEVITRMRKNFFMPSKQEGFDKIQLLYDDDGVSVSRVIAIMDMKDFNQHNPHHNLTLYEHSEKVEERFLGKLLNNGEFNFQKYEQIGFLHDIGKLYTKSFYTIKGNKKEFASYYNHENVSAYEAMFILKGSKSKDDIIHNCNMIQYHMIFHNMTEKSAKKWRLFLGNKMFEDLLLLHEADLEGKE